MLTNQQIDTVPDYIEGEWTDYNLTGIKQQAILAIDLAAEVDRLKAERAELFDYLGDDPNAAGKNISAIFQENKRLKAERRWIPVSEPPNDDRPLLLTDGLDIYSGFYRNGNWHELNGYVLDGITHYQEQMPLPLEGSEK